MFVSIRDQSEIAVFFFRFRSRCQHQGGCNTGQRWHGAGQGVNRKGQKGRSPEPRSRESAQRARRLGETVGSPARGQTWEAGQSRSTAAAVRRAAAPQAPQVRGRLCAGRPPRVPHHAPEGERPRVRGLREELREEPEPGQAPEDPRGRQAFQVPGLRPELQRLVQPRGPPAGLRGREAEPVCRVRAALHRRRPRQGSRRPEPLRG